MRTSVSVPLALLALLALATACVRGGDEPPKAPDTLAVEAEAGPFPDYMEQVLRLARRHGADPDSFRVALDALPGSHLTDEEWEAWTRPSRENPAPLADRIEEVLTDLASGR